MKKKYFTPEMEEMEMGNLVLLDGSTCPPDESEVVPCADETPAPPCPDDEEV